MSRTHNPIPSGIEFAAEELARRSSGAQYHLVGRQGWLLASTSAGEAVRAAQGINRTARPRDLSIRNDDGVVVATVRRDGTVVYGSLFPSAGRSQGDENL